MTVSIAACGSYEKQEVRTALATLLEPLGGLEWVRPGMKIAIKTNLITIAKPESAVTTHPTLLCALIEMLIEKGASVTLGDSPSGPYKGVYIRRVYAAAGLKAAKRAGAKLNCDFSVREASFPQAKALKNFVYTGWLDQADAIINFCKLKTHGMMAMSSAVKNLFGTIPGTRKPELHYRFPDRADFADMLVDLNEYFKPRLVIVDGVVGMEGNGPTSGTPRPIGVLIASKNPHAADLLGSALIGLNPQEVPTLAAAIKRGLIPNRPEDLQIKGIDWTTKIVPDYRPVDTIRPIRFSSDSKTFFGKLFAKASEKAMTAHPKTKNKACVGCGECQKICSAKAITLKDQKAQIDRKACVHCLRCYDICPNDAIKIHRTIPARMMSK